MAIKYELRHDDNPSAMPLGTATISTHGTKDAAVNAMQREWRHFRRHLAETGQQDSGAYLQRVVVAVDGDGDEWAVSRGPYGG